MSNTVREVLTAITREASAQKVAFQLARKGRKHTIYHLGTTVVLPVPHSKVSGRIRFEMFKACEPELGYRWWMPADRQLKVPDDLPCTVAKGFRGPRGKHA